MTPRQAAILSTLIREYVRTAEPVGSELLVERYRLPYSAATVRAELGDLEEGGYLSHPHTSAGRMPTARGYRYYVDHLHAVRRASADARLEDAFTELAAEHRRIARRAAKVLAAFSGNLALAGLRETEELHEAGLSGLLEEPEFVAAERLRDLSKLIDVLDARFDEFMEGPVGEVRVYIGEENPYVRSPYLSMIVASCQFPSGERGLVAIVGPTRMRYERNIGLVDHVLRLLEADTTGRNV